MFHIIPISIILFTGLNWGLSFSLARFTAIYGAHPFGVSLWQTFIATIILIFLCSYVKMHELKLNFQLFLLYIILSLISLVIPGILFYFSAAHLPAGILAITVTLVPIITYLLALFLKLEFFSFLRLSGVLLGISSILILILPEQSLPDQSKIWWVLAACFCSLLYALQGIITSIKFEKTSNPIVMAFWLNLFATIIVAPVVFYFGYQVPIAFPLNILGFSLIGLGLIEAICFSLFMYVLTRYGALFASQTGYIVTLSGVVWGMIIFHEEHSLWVWLSVLMMLTGLALVTPRNKEDAIKQNFKNDNVE